MKIKNKRTGEIRTLCVDMEKPDNGIRVYADNGILYKMYNSLAELCEEWIDYEEPKGFWIINVFGIVEYQKNCDIEPAKIEYLESIGNYFLSEEEAEEAVRKLRAWNWLQEKGFKFDSTPYCNSLCGNGFEIHFSAIMPPEFWNNNDVKEELTFLFGGEE